VKRSLWKDRYYAGSFPAFPCPKCSSGALRLKKETLAKLWEPIGDADPMSQEGKFVCLLVCSTKYCAVAAGMSGFVRSGYDQGYDSNGEPTLIEEEHFHPTSLVPGSPLIGIPRQTPDTVRNFIEQSFSLVWTDQAAAVNKLRVSIERLLDHFEIPRSVQSNKGKGHPLGLSRRIELFQAKGIGHEDTLDAMRAVGNRGSHGNPVSFEMMLDAFEIYEEALEDIFAGKQRRLASLRDKLRKLDVSDA
jgi:hypothetical protein